MSEETERLTAVYVPMVRELEREVDEGEGERGREWERERKPLG